MGFPEFWRKDFSVWFTWDGFQRLLRLCKKLECDEDAFAPVIDRALALYDTAVASRHDDPFFRLDASGEHVPCFFKDCLAGPCGPYAYEFHFCCSWAEWRTIRRMMAKADEHDLTLCVGRALELLELHLNGKLPQLYAIDRRGDYEPVNL